MISRGVIAYFTEISGRDLPFADLKLENCELTCNQVVELLGVLSAMKRPLNVLSIKGNRLGRYNTERFYPGLMIFRDELMLIIFAFHQ